MSSINDRPHIGQLDRKVIIEQPVIVRGDSGGDTVTWSTLATVWARKLDQTAGSDEGVEVDRQTSTVISYFAIRHRSDVTAKMRVNVDSNYYYITAITEIGRRDFINLKTEIRDHG